MVTSAYGETEVIEYHDNVTDRVITRHGIYLVTRLFGGYVTLQQITTGEGGECMVGAVQCNSAAHALRVIRSRAIL